MTLTLFRESIRAALRDGTLRDGVIGAKARIPGPDGEVPLVYADYVASGRALRQVEDFVLDQVLPFYANSHSEASFCGAATTRLREAARAEIARLTGAGDDAVIFAGSGATAGLNRLVSLLGVNEAASPVVLIGPYEHHSNILPWRDSKARVVEIPEAADGGPDLDALAAELDAHSGSDLLIGSFSAASNVTGIVTDSQAVTRLVKARGGRAVWDCAGAGPYLPIDMGHGSDARKDAVVVSAHKFPGGPGASGVLIVNRDAVRSTRPTWPGGGTVAFVSPWAHDYLDDMVAREEAGTPNVIGDIRAALAFIVKDAVGAGVIAETEERYNRMALDRWGANPHLILLGIDRPQRLPIFSFLVRDGAGGIVDEQVFTRMLSDLYGIQARGGCACAGPYGHRLLGIGRDASDRLRADLRAGREVRKPGWVRLNFSYMMDAATVRYIIASVDDLSRNFDDAARRYRAQTGTGTGARRDAAA